MTQAEFEALLADASKHVVGDITWSPDEDHSPTVEFRAEVGSDVGYPLFVKGSYNGVARTLSYSLIHRGSGRIYALDLGKEHHNPSCSHVGELHKHRWAEQTRDKEAYAPSDVTAEVTAPVAVWRQFCVEARLDHRGMMHDPPDVQMEML